MIKIILILIGLLLLRSCALNAVGEVVFHVPNDFVGVIEIRESGHGMDEENVTHIERGPDGAYHVHIPMTGLVLVHSDDFFDRSNEFMAIREDGTAVSYVHDEPTDLDEIRFHALWHDGKSNWFLVGNQADHEWAWSEVSITAGPMDRTNDQ